MQEHVEPHFERNELALDWVSEHNHSIRQLASVVRCVLFADSAGRMRYKYWMW
jgi:hypothetical protein